MRSLFSQDWTLVSVSVHLVPSFLGPQAPPTCDEGPAPASIDTGNPKSRGTINISVSPRPRPSLSASLSPFILTLTLTLTLILTSLSFTAARTRRFRGDTNVIAFRLGVSGRHQQLSLRYYVPDSSHSTALGLGVPDGRLHGYCPLTASHQLNRCHFTSASWFNL